MNIENLTVKELKELGIELSEETALKLRNMMDNINSHWVIGENYLIRTVTMMVCGKLKKITGKELILSSASWIADSGRFHNALKDGFKKSAEIEPFVNDVIINRNSIVDATKYSHQLPEVQQ